jgi:ribosomal protein L37E
MPDRPSAHDVHVGASRSPDPNVTAPSSPSPGRVLKEDAMPCDRCGAEMFRMHAVWRCPACGYKTDCCGW